MPYIARGKCVYKRDTGKKVGCTKGSVKKYLAALHANVNESNGVINNEERFLDDKVLVFDPPIELEDYLEKLAPILMSMDIKWFDGQPLKKGREIGKDVYNRNRSFKYFLFDRKEPKKDYYTQYNWVMSALPTDKELKKYQKEEEEGVGNSTAQQFNNSEKIDGWGFVNNFKDVIGFDPFNQLNESEEDFDWVPTMVQGNISLPFRELFNSDILKPGDVIEISGSITNGNPNNEKTYVTFDKTPLRLHDVNEYKGVKSMNFEWVQPTDSRPKGWNIVSTDGYFDTDSTTVNNNRWLHSDGNLIVSAIIKSNINESEDLGWAQEAVNNIDLTDAFVYYDKGLTPKQWIILRKIFLENGIRYLNGDYESLSPNVYHTPHGGFRVDKKNTILFLDFDKVSRDRFLHSANDPWNKLVNAEDSQLTFEAIEKLFQGYFRFINAYHLINSYELKNKGSMNESEEDLEWVEDTVSDSSVVDNLLSYKGKEIIIDVEALNANEMVRLYDILEPYVVNTRSLIPTDDGGEVYWTNDCFQPNWGSLTNTQRIGVVSLHCGIEDNDYKPVKGLVCCLPTIEDALSTLEKGSYIQVDGRILLSMVEDKINESEEDELEWAQDAISGLEHYEEWDGKTNLTDDTFLIINGIWDGLEFYDQPAKIVRRAGHEDEQMYLLTFPKVLDGYEQHTHCGNPEEHIDDEYKCHCEDSDSQRGRCWYVELNALSDVKVFPNRKGFLGESEEDGLEWVQDIVSDVDTNFKHQAFLDGKAWSIFLPGDEDSFIEAQKWVFSKGFKWMGEDHGALLDKSEYRSYSSLCSIGSIFHDNIDSKSLTYDGNREGCNREKWTEQTIRIAKNNSKRKELYLFEWDKSKKSPNLKDVISLTINESEGDDLEWAEDITNTNPTYRFRDLVFKPHHIPGAVRARLNFPNGHYISVVGGPHLYGDGINTFEIWRSDEDDVQGNLTKDEVTQQMLELQELPPLEGNGTFRKEPITEDVEEFDWVKDLEHNEYWVDMDKLSIGDYVIYKKGQAIEEPKDGGFWNVVRFRTCSTYNPNDWSVIKMPCVDLQSVKDAKGQRWLTGENMTVIDKPEEFKNHPKHFQQKFKILDKVDWLRERGWRVPLKGNWHLNDLNLKLDESKVLTEGRYDALTRQVVKDIMTKVTETRGQNDEVLEFELPNDIHPEMYEYIKDGINFVLELNVHHQQVMHRPAQKEEETYYVHTAISDDEDENVIMMTVVVDPSHEPQVYESLFYKLQEDIRHEIEHLTQVDRSDTANLKTTYGHHKNKFEVPALVHGFYRRAKLEKRPLDEIMIEDLDSEISRGNLNKKQAQKLLQIWVDYAKKNLPTAIYSNE